MQVKCRSILRQFYHHFFIKTQLKENIFSDSDKYPIIVKDRFLRADPKYQKTR